MGIKNENIKELCGKITISFFCLIVISLFFQEWLLNAEKEKRIEMEDELFFQWAFDEELKKDSSINIKKARKKFSPKRTIVIAVIDTSIDYGHNSFKDHIWINKKEIENDNIDNDSNGFIDDKYGWNFVEDNNEIYNTDDMVGASHGTECVGILGSDEKIAGIKGVLQDVDASIICIKALNHDGKGKKEDVTKAIKYAEDNGAQLCCLSLSTKEEDVELYKAIKKSKMLFVVAAGNDGVDIDKKGNHVYPVSYDLDNIVGVANINKDGNLNATSNYGERSVDIAAPGTDILSCSPGNSFQVMSGTSMSACFVAGAIAMKYCHEERGTLIEAKEEVLKCARKMPQLEGKIKTKGTLDIGNTIESESNYEEIIK